jgi:hypothetical protein
MPKCEEKDCKEEGSIPCMVNDYDPETKESKEIRFDYCSEHASGNGFCWGCGLLWAGVEDFDFNNPSGLCGNCRDEIEDEIGVNDDEPGDFEVVVNGSTEVQGRRTLRLEIRSQTPRLD